MTRSDVADKYFDWLVDLVCGERYSEDVSYRKLLTRLHSIEFKYLIPNDQNRAEDGEALRYRYAVEQGYDHRSINIIMDILYGPCSVFEMLTALAVKCEENIMYDPNIGDRTRQWFWGMITNLGLGSMVDSRFDQLKVDNAIHKFMDRHYEPNGRGGLFTVKGCEHDLRDVEIWYQLCWYLDGIT